jgi:hypothetical protein
VPPWDGSRLRFVVFRRIFRCGLRGCVATSIRLVALQLQLQVLFLFPPELQQVSFGDGMRRSA